MSIQDVVKGYTEALLWANTYHEVRIGDTLDSELEQYGSAHVEFSFDDFDADDRTDILDFVCEFIDQNQADYEAYLAFEERPGGRDAYDRDDLFGHDLLLTRSGHGTGFWDRGLGDLGDRLTEAARVYGDTSAEVRDGKIVLVES